VAPLFVGVVVGGVFYGTVIVVDLVVVVVLLFVFVLVQGQW